MISCPKLPVIKIVKFVEMNRIIISKVLNLPIFILPKLVVLAIYNFGEEGCLRKLLSVYI